MSVIYRIKNEQGETIEMSPQQIMSQANQVLQQGGKSIQAITPDGLTAQVIQNGQAYTVPLANFLKAGGLQIESALPSQQSTDFSMVNPGWRFGIANLSDDAQKASYLKSKLEKEGIKEPQIVGSGRDFFYYDAPSGKWQALTNSPEWDLADLAEAGQSVPGIVGGALGAMGGAVVGSSVPVAGTIAGAGVGGAGGTAAGESLSRGLAASFDPEYRQAFDLGKAAEDVGIQAVMGGVIPAGAGVLGKVAAPVLGRAGQVLKSPLSSTARATGATTSGAGKIAQAGRVLESGPGKFVGSMTVPGATEATILGSVAQLPGMATRGIGKAGQWIGQKTGSEGLRRAFAGDTAEEIMGSLGRTLGKRFSGATGAAEEAMAKARAVGPVQPDVLRRAAREAVVGKARPMAQAGEQYGQTVGRGLDALGRGGQAVVTGAEEAVGLGGRALGAGGAMLEKTGRGISAAGRATAPLEPYAIQQIARDQMMRQPQLQMPQQYLPQIPQQNLIRSPYAPAPGQIPISAQRPSMPSWYQSYDLEI